MNPLELTYQERTQKMLRGLMEDIGELNARVDKLQRQTPAWDEEYTPDPWADDNFPIPWSNKQDNGFVFGGAKNEVVSGIALPATRVIHFDEGHLAGEKKTMEPVQTKGPVIIDPDQMPQAPTQAPTQTLQAPTQTPTQTLQTPTQTPKEAGGATDPDQTPTLTPKEAEGATDPDQLPEEAEGATEEVLEELEEELEEVVFQGTTYYKDSESNIYTADAEGQIGDTPVGRWVRQSIKFYPS